MRGKPIKVTLELNFHTCPYFGVTPLVDSGNL